MKQGLQPARRTNKVNDIPARKIPNGMYDTIDGFYDPIAKCVYDPKDLKKIIRYVKAVCYLCILLIDAHFQTEILLQPDTHSHRTA